MKKWQSLLFCIPILMGCNILEVSERIPGMSDEIIEGISMEIFDALEFGMSIEQVHQLIGAEPSWNSWEEGDYQRWNGEHQFISVGFERGYVSHIALFGESRQEPVGVNDFYAIDFAMSRSEMEAIMGSVPTVISTMRNSGWENLSLEWHDEDNNRLGVSIFNDGWYSISFSSERVANALELVSFDSITAGMTREEIGQIMEAPPTVQSKSLREGTITYHMAWMSRSGYYYNVYFDGDRVTATSVWRGNS